MNYTGKEVCQGCKKTGRESPRLRKDDLCYKCEEIHRRGKSIGVEGDIEYQLVFQHYHAFRSEVLNKYCIEILKAIDNPFAKTGVVESIFWATGSNGIYARIPIKMFQPLKDLFKNLYSFYKELEDKSNSLQSLAEQEINKERDRVFMEGVETGRKLLMQLNSGEISIDQFNNNYSYYQRATNKP